ncbi:hypothetical protein GJAV_G00115530 [Gymnothorax javanicus]|nr:hypothetical protein GJAV_G00115530 [Gymnothorax javanicus]
MTDYSGQGLPFLPGNTFRDITKSAQHRPQTLTYKNGYIAAKRPKVGIGQEALHSDHLNLGEINQLTKQNLAQTHEQFSAGASTEFVPAHVFFDKKVLCFHGYFKQLILLSPHEQYRIRPVIFSYFLEDDSCCVIEPEVENSGMPQGKLIKRQRLPKNKLGDFYHWKDLNVGIDICVFGVTYRLTDCDKRTKEFLESEGILLNEPEMIPPDPYSEHRAKPLRTHVTPSDFDNLKQFLCMDRKVLRFFARWAHSDSVHSETRPVIIHYYLADNSVEIRETHEHNSGRDPYPVLLRRQKVAKNVKPKTEPFPSCVLEVSPKEVEEYYSPKDFCVGESISILGREFLLYDCDEFTWNYYKENFSEITFKPLRLKPKTSPGIKRELPPYNGFGSLEDSLQNCKFLIPEPPKKDLLKMLENDGKVLRYTARLESLNPDDSGRRFILSYFLSNDTISMFEKPQRNSGIIGGKFFREDPGLNLQVFGRRFVLLDADLYVLNYLETVADQIPSGTLNSLRQHLRPDHKETEATDEILETKENVP